jgi:hypothetical protein
MAAGSSSLRTLFRVTLPQVALGVAFGLIATLLFFLGLFFSAGGGLLIDPSEIPVSLAGALGGPAGGIIAGLLQGIIFAPERNIPSHMVAGLFAGIWYFAAWTFGAKSTRPRLTRVAIWLIGMPIYYFAVLAPVYIAIYSFTIRIPFIELYREFAPPLFLELVLTMLATSVILAVLPEKFARPLQCAQKVGKGPDDSG